MRLRDHPKIRGGWGAVWASIIGPGDTLPQGEMGTLRRVRKAARHITLVTECDGREHLRVVLSDDEAFLAVLMDFITQHCVGLSIAEICGMAVDF